MEEAHGALRRGVGPPGQRIGVYEVTSWFYQRTVRHSEGRRGGTPSAYEWGEPARAENGQRVLRDLGNGVRSWCDDSLTGERLQPEGAGP